MGRGKGKKKNKRPEYAAICREFNREMDRIDISVIDSGVTNQLMKGLVMLHMRDPHKRYFLTNTSDYQKYVALMKKQIKTMSIQNNKKIVELGGRTWIMDKTKIDWADSTWNPVTGCLHGCEYCYAKGIAHRFDGGKKLKYGARTILDEPVIIDGNKSAYPFGFTPAFHRYRLNDYIDKKGRNIFVCSMADLFGKWVPDSWIEEVFAACEKAPQHNCLFLTKNPQRYVELAEKGILKYSDNMWYGSTVTAMEEYFSSENTYNTFLSIEPMLSSMSPSTIGGVKWIIIGAETGRRKDKVIPEKCWIERIVEDCKRRNIPVFMKSSLEDIWGEPLIQEFPDKLKHEVGK